MRCLSGKYTDLCKIRIYFALGTPIKAVSPIACPPPGECISRCKQVSRLCFILHRPSPPVGGAGYTRRLQVIAFVSQAYAWPHSRTFPLSQWLPLAICLRAFVSFTVTGIARKFHPIPMIVICSYNYRASLRRYTGYSFVDDIITLAIVCVNRSFNKS